ncbi:MAG: hypothetical protein WDO19_18840 [Bacteroidota bacterium]
MYCIFQLGLCGSGIVSKAVQFWFFSSSNPTITFGGFEGESKREMYDQLPPSSFPKTIYIKHDLLFADVKAKVREHGFSFPFIVKPDVGMKGILFRRIDNEDQLQKYHDRIPGGVYYPGID